LPVITSSSSAASATVRASGGAAVAALGGRGQARRDRGGGTAARPARRPGQVPRRAGRRADLGLGVAGQPELGGGGLAGDDRAGPLDRDHHVVVGVGHVGLEGLGAQRLPYPGDHVQVLDRDRHAGQRGQRRLVLGRGQRFLRRQGLVGGEFGGDGVEGTHLVVELLRPAQIMIGDGDRRELARAHRGG